MISFGIVAAVIFAGLAVHVIWHYVPCFRELLTALKQTDSPSLEYVPNARVILCLRGIDPFLDRCLKGLVNQDYPNYKIIIVVDSAEDSALPQAQELLKQFGHAQVEIHIRDQLLPCCTRKISSLSCGLNRVPDDVEVVAMCDADAIPHSTWLRELVVPLQDPMTVATSGNRWYAPIVLTTASSCRYFWNALAFRAMHKYHIPWAGSLAMRRDLFRDEQFLDCLHHAFSEDTALAGFLANKKLRASPIVSLIVLNEESTGLKNFWGFLVRQMLAARLSHPHWPAIFSEAMVIFFLMWILLPLSIIQSAPSFFLWCVGGAIYDLAVLSVVGYFEWLIRKYLWQKRRQLATPYSWKRILLMPVGLLATGFLYPLAVAATIFAKRHEWRGIVYRIESRGVTTIRENEGFASHALGQCDSV